MRIGATNGSTMINMSMGGAIAGIRLPNFGSVKFLTNANPPMNDDRYKAAVAAQAKKDKEEGIFQASPAFHSLLSRYVAKASPNRQGIIMKGLIAAQGIPEVETTNKMLDILLGKLKIEKKDKKISYAEFYDSNGELIATYSNSGWQSFATQAEMARDSELRSIYNSAWNEA